MTVTDTPTAKEGGPVPSSGGMLQNPSQGVSVDAIQVRSPDLTQM